MTEENVSLKRPSSSLGILLILPGLIAFTLIIWLPLFGTLGLSFFDWDIQTPPRHVGLGNFTTLLNDVLFWKSIGNTIFLTIGNMIPIFVIPLLISLLALKASRKARERFTTVYFIPIALAIFPIGIFIIWRWMYNPDFGLVNFALAKFGLKGLQWLSSTTWAKPASILLFLCQFMPLWIGAALIVYGAYQRGMKSKDNRAITFRTVTLLFLIIAFLASSGWFGGSYVMTGGGPAGSTTTVLYYIYSNTYQWFKLGYAAVVSFFPIIFSLILGIIVWRITEKQSLRIGLLDNDEKREEQRGTGKLNIILILIGLITIVPAVVPFLWAFSTAIKQPGDVFVYPPKFIPEVFRWDNFSKAWSAVPMGRFYINSIIKTCGTLIFQIPIAFLAAYSISILKVPGRKVIFFLITATMLLPITLIRMPIFVVIRQLNLIDSHIALIIPYIAWGFAVFIFKLSFDGLSVKVSEAREKGMAEGEIFKKLVLPSSWPIILGVSVLSAYHNWGGFKWPLVVVNKMSAKTLPIGLASFQGLHTTDWTLLNAGAILAAIPGAIVFLAILLLLKRPLFNRLVITRSNGEQ